MLVLGIALTACLLKAKKIPANFAECVQAGNPVMESYPRQCRSESAGKTFTEILTPEEQARINPPDIIKPTTDEFCGWSTNEACALDLDCVVGGCSGQVCQAKDNAGIITTCEAKKCYEASQYDYTCQCANQICNWVKEN